MAVIPLNISTTSSGLLHYGAEILRPQKQVCNATIMFMLSMQVSYFVTKISMVGFRMCLYHMMVTCGRFYNLKQLSKTHIGYPTVAAAVLKRGLFYLPSFGRDTLWVSLIRCLRQKK